MTAFSKAEHDSIVAEGAAHAGGTRLRRDLAFGNTRRFVVAVRTCCASGAPARVTGCSFRVEEVILVLPLVDGTLDAIRTTLDDFDEDFTDHGFQEIRLAAPSRE
ncbi:hypothetical protein [Burkholderia oklahomensis]|uniref:hypothetical protein n=1 Tax=Burkholderia oklahomensis TaxID=342113 RepID=UPI0011982A0A|nr:hypothetical protein I6G57_17790 [Burkholderia oklahomensis]